MEMQYRMPAAAFYKVSGEVIQIGGKIIGVTQTEDSVLAAMIDNVLIIV